MKSPLTLLLLFTLLFQAVAQNTQQAISKQQRADAQSAQAIINFQRLAGQLDAVTATDPATATVKINMSGKEGSKDFTIWKNTTLSTADFTVYAGLSNQQDNLHVLIGSQGIDAFIMHADGDIEVTQKLTNGDYTFVTSELGNQTVGCGHHDDLNPTLPGKTKQAGNGAGQVAVTSSGYGGTKYTYELALLLEQDFYDEINNNGYAGMTGDAAANAYVATLIAAINVIYENEMAVSFVPATALSGQNFGLAATLDATNSAGLDDIQTKNDAAFGSANYDIGIGIEFFSGGGGSGLAQLFSLCQDGQKSRDGIRTRPFSSGNTFNAFVMTYLAIHEMGHQFGSAHTFNSTTGSTCFASRSSDLPYEPGSGSTIMSYAGLCKSQNIDPGVPDFYFHIASLDIMTSFIESSFVTCHTTTSVNTAPTADAGQDFTIPTNTPFELIGTAADANGDNLTYSWEQYDKAETPSDEDLFYTTAANDATAPLFRSEKPDSDPSRIFPSLTYILDNQNLPPTAAAGEILPFVSRNMTFRFTVRDNQAGAGNLASDTMDITVVDTGNDFAVTSQNSGGSFISNGTNTMTITWDVAGTNANGINVSAVDIMISTDGGQSFNFLAADNTPNDGSESITVPNFNTTQARVKIKAEGNIFFDINNQDFSISSACGVSAAIADTSTFTDTAGKSSLVLSPDLLYDLSTTSFTGTVTSGSPQGQQAFASLWWKLQYQYRCLPLSGRKNDCT